MALETAFLTTGLPAPHHLEAMDSMTQAVRAQGAVPAAVGVVQGELVVGLALEELESLVADPPSGKASARDLPGLISRGGSAGTTVAATLTACRLSGIRVFATGGIGGVHRYGSEHFDVSADLFELARTRCCVVSSGAKSILDLPATLEWLETLSVPVLGYRTDHLPQFYCLGSEELPVPHRVDVVAEAARLCRTRWRQLEQDGGVLLANPVPADAALDRESVDAALGRALYAAREAQIRGAALTPFLLERMRAETEGRSLAANLALLESNADLAAQLAVAMLQ